MKRFPSLFPWSCNLFLMSPSKKRDTQEMKHLDDQDLMRIVQAGDFSPASEIYDRYAGRLYNFAYRYLRNGEAARDATQEVFVKMMKHANQFHADAKLGTWLFAITANWCRDYLRKMENKPKEPEEVLLGLPASHDDSPYRKLEQHETAKLIEKALSTLTPDQREAILLSKYQGFSYLEIAQIAGCSEGAVKTRVFRGMEALKKALTSPGEAGGGDECLNVMS